MNYILPLTALAVGYYLYTKQPSLESLRDEPSLTLYYWSSCGHCRAMMPDWNSLGSRVGRVHIRKVEANSNNELEVDSFPTIIYREGRTMERFSGGRSHAALMQYLQSKQY